MVQTHYYLASNTNLYRVDVEFFILTIYFWKCLGFFESYFQYQLKQEKICPKSMIRKKGRKMIHCLIIYFCEVDYKIFYYFLLKISKTLQCLRKYCFQKISVAQFANVIKAIFLTGSFQEFCLPFRNRYFKEHLPCGYRAESYPQRARFPVKDYFVPSLTILDVVLERSLVESSYSESFCKN